MSDTHPTDGASAAGLSIERRDAVKLVTFTRPDVGNCLSAGMAAALHQAVLDSHADGTRLLVLQAQGKHFCTGFDLSNLDDENDDSLLARFTRIELLLQALRHAPFTTAALAQGGIVGAGADLFAACDHRIATPAGFLSFPGAGFGLVLGSAHLARLVGTGKARQWISSGARVAAPEALDSGLATALADPSEFPGLPATLAGNASRLDAATHVAIRQATDLGAAQAAADLAALVRSAARPGLKQRIIDYRARQQQARGKDGRG